MSSVALEDFTDDQHHGTSATTTKTTTTKDKKITIDVSKVEQSTDFEKAQYKKDLINMLYLGFCFFVVIFTFVATQNLQSQLNATVGYIGLALLYTSYGIAALFAAPLISHLGEKNAFILGGVSFTCFIASNIQMHTGLFYAACIFNGAAGSIFWVAQGTYLNRFSTDKTRHRFSSIFVSFIASANFVGNGFTLVIQQDPNFTFTAMFIAFSIFCFVTSIGMWGIRKLERPAMVPFNQTMKELGQMFCNRDMVFLLPGIFSYGINLTYIFGYFPDKIGNTEWSSAALTCYGAVHIIVSLSGQRIAHYLNGNLLILISAIGLITGSVIATYADDNSRYLYLIAGCFLGAMEAGFLTTFFNMTGRDFSASQQLSVNSVFRFFVGLVMGVLFVMSVVLTYYEVFALMIIVQLFGIFMVFLKTKLDQLKRQKIVDQETGTTVRPPIELNEDLE